MGLLSYLKIGVLVAALAVGGGFVWHYQHLKAQNRILKAEVVTLQRIAEIYERDAEIDKEIADEKARVDRLTPAELDAEYERLRQYGRAGKSANP